MKILANILITPDGTKLQSFHRHDFKLHLDSNGNSYMIDGGLDYVKSSCNGDEQYLTITSDDPFTLIREHFSWGTRGVNGDQPVMYKPLKSLDTSHIQAILETQTHITSDIRNLFVQELEFRS